ncbi:MAG: hypothetical protein WAK60_05590 [Sedimentisphaerales bacterium]
MNTIINIVELLNRNQGALMTLLTFIYVIATIVLVQRTRKSNELARQAIMQSMEFEKQRNRPHVIFDLIAKDRCFYATIKNLGKQPAYDVKVTSKPDILRGKGSQQKEKISFIEKKVPFLAPDREIEDYIGTTPDFLKEYPETTFCVEISYKDSRGEAYHEMADISIGFYMHRRTVWPDDPIKKIETHMDRMVWILQEIQKVQQQMTWVQNRILESGILKQSFVGHSPNTVRELDLNLTKEEIKYLLVIADQEGGRIYSNRLSAFTGKDTELYREMLNKFVQIGLMREELDYWTLTAKGYTVCENLQQENPKV